MKRFRAPIEELKSEVLAELGDKEFVAQLKRMWESEARRVPAASVGERETTFKELTPHLRTSIEESRVVLDNSLSDDRLDYTGDPVVAIAVGGNTLSRGLTLEGLVVSYFVRAASAYDTLLQMGRWFGYRAGYADLPRIWMTHELQGWFRHLAGVEAEIRQDIERYMTDDVTPETFAVRIRAHPSLAITAAAKMKDAVVTQASYGGMRIQTRYFHSNDDAWLGANEEAAKRLVERIGGRKRAESSSPIAGYLWSDVAAEEIIAFLESYRVHEKAADNDTSRISDYVRGRNERGRFLQWSVATIGSSTAGRGDFDFGAGVEVPRIIRSRLIDSPDEAADIKTLMSRRDAAADLILKDGEVLTEPRLVQLRQEQASDAPLLALYAIDRTSPTKRETRQPLDAARDVLAMGIVFPKPAITDNDSVYWSADLSHVLEPSDGYVELEDLSALELEQQ
jgi:hypothetical protein